VPARRWTDPAFRAIIQNGLPPIARSVFKVFPPEATASNGLDLFHPTDKTAFLRLASFLRCSSWRGHLDLPWSFIQDVPAPMRECVVSFGSRDIPPEGLAETFAGVPLFCLAAPFPRSGEPLRRHVGPLVLPFSRRPRPAGFFPRSKCLEQVDLRFPPTKGSTLSELIYPDGGPPLMPS